MGGLGNAVLCRTPAYMGIGGPRSQVQPLISHTIHAGCSITHSRAELLQNPPAAALALTLPRKLSGSSSKCLCTSGYSGFLLTLATASVGASRLTSFASGLRQFIHVCVPLRVLHLQRAAVSVD
jgi:hypothetical protein